MAPWCVKPCTQTPRATSPLWLRASTGPGARTWGVWKVRSKPTKSTVSINQHLFVEVISHQFTDEEAVKLILPLICLILLILTRCSFIDLYFCCCPLLVYFKCNSINERYIEYCWTPSSYLLVYATLQTTRCLLPPAESPRGLGHRGARPLPSNSSHPSPHTLTRTRHLTTTTTSTSLGHHQAFAPWGPPCSGVSLMFTIPSPPLARSDDFRCPHKEKLQL